MRFNYKKISAVLTSALLTGMTLGIASAAAFPTDFTSQLPAIVYGANADPLDQTQATAISNYLADKVPSTGGDVTGGDSVKLEKSSTKFQVSYGTSDVIGTAITDSSPGNGLPTLLADGIFIDNDNDEFDYTQQINLANWSLTMFDDNDYKQDTPTLGVKSASGSSVLNYTLEFTDKPYWSDLATSDIPLLGKKYYVLSQVENTTLNLLDSSSGTITLSEGETKTVTVGGKSYEVAINFIGSSTVKLDVNGETTNTLSAAETQRLSDGAYLGVKEINTQDYAGGIKTVQFAIGKGKLKLSGTSVQLNDNTINGLTLALTNAGDGTDDQISKISLKWAADDDTFIADGSSPIMPGFESVKLSWAGMVFPAQEKIMIEPSSSTTLTLKQFPLKDSVEDIDLIYTLNTTGLGGMNFSNTGIGKEMTNQLATSPNNTLLFNNSNRDEQFVASWSDGNDAESYLMRFAGWTADSDTEKANVEYKNNGVWTVAKEKAKAADVVTLGNLEFTVDYVNRTTKVATITKGSNVNFSTLYSKEGMKVYLPWLSIAATTASPLAGGHFGPLNDSWEGTWNLTVSEEDKNENIAKGGNVTFTIAFNAQSTPELHVGAIRYITEYGDDSGTASQIGSTDTYLNYLYTPLASEVIWDKSGDQYDATLTYHGEESYGQFYISSATASIGNVGNMVFKDSEKASWEAKNVILVGGSCINTATATALGLSVGTCAEAWKTATGVGAGKYLIQSVADKFTAGKIALVVAGYNKDDTAAAVSKLINQGSTIDTATGKKWVGTVGVEGSSTVTQIV